MSKLEKSSKWMKTMKRLRDVSELRKVNIGKEERKEGRRKRCNCAGYSDSSAPGSQQKDLRCEN